MLVSFGSRFIINYRFNAHTKLPSSSLFSVSAGDTGGSNVSSCFIGHAEIDHGDRC
jgi:hypothetical protein